MINSHVIQSQKVGKFTGHISNNTSKSTSETDRIRSGGPSGPGAPGITRKRAARRGAGPRPKGSVLLEDNPPWGATGTLRAGPKAREKRQERENNGYPFTTSSRFLRLSWDIIHESLCRDDLVVGRQIRSYFPGNPPRCSGTIRGSRRNSLGRTRFFYSRSNILG